jgi:hypothetical protein
VKGAGVTGPEHDSDLNPEYRAKAVEREADQEHISRAGFANIIGVGSRRDPDAPRQGWLENRRAKVIAEIERNRRGEYKVPTWVLTLILVVVIVGLVALFTFL